MAMNQKQSTIDEDANFMLPIKLPNYHHIKEAKLLIKVKNVLDMRFKKKKYKKS